MTHGGMGPGLILTGSKSAAAVFEAYVGQAQIPTLRPGQVVVVDNLLPHKGERGVHELLERWGCNLLYLLPDSLDLNPVEEAVFKVKGALQTASRRTHPRGAGWRHGSGSRRTRGPDARAFFEHCRNQLSAPSL
jgi:hypothetical protein